MAKPLLYRVLVQLLRAHDRRFDIRPGKGSEVVLRHPDYVSVVTLPHHGDGDTIGIGLLACIARTFDLPPGFFDRGGRRKTPHVPAAPKFVRHTLPRFRHDPHLDFVWMRDGVLELFIPQDWRDDGFVSVHRFGRCPVCNEVVQDTGEPCFICHERLDASVFDPSVPAPSGSGSTPPSVAGPGRGSRASGARKRTKGRRGASLSV